jgi:hypothetical protein
MSTAPTPRESDRLTFPALLPAEINVLRAWLRLHEGEYDRFDYNVRVGPGFDPGPALHPNDRQMAIDNTRKRIDALAWRGGQPTIIEVKDRAGLSCIGQLMGYVVHWNLEHPNGPRPYSLLVANRLAPGVEDVLNHHGLLFVLVDVQ